MKKITLKKMTNYIKTSIKCLEIASLLIESEVIANQEKGNKKMNLEIFNYNEKEIRTQLLNNEPYFCLKDVAEILEIKNHRDSIERLNQKGVANTDTLTKGGIQKMVFINESNLYKLIFQSRKPEAEKFTEWVTSEVLPSIRKHGAYMTDSTLEQALTSPDFLIKLATNLKLEKEKNKELEGEIEIKNQIIGELKPAKDYLDCILASDDTMKTTQIAGDYGMSAQALNKILAEEGIIRKVNKQWILYTKHMNKGYTKSNTFKVREDKYIIETVWTQKGRLMIHEILKSLGYKANIDKEVS